MVLLQWSFITNRAKLKHNYRCHYDKLWAFQQWMSPCWLIWQKKIIVFTQNTMYCHLSNVIQFSFNFNVQILSTKWNVFTDNELKMCKLRRTTCICVCVHGYVTKRDLSLFGKWFFFIATTTYTTKPSMCTVEIYYTQSRYLRN